MFGINMTKLPLILNLKVIFLKKYQFIWRMVLNAIGSLSIFAALFLCYRYYMGQREYTPVLLLFVLGFSCISLARKYSQSYVQQCKLDNLITRNQQLLTFKNKPESGCEEKGVDLDASRLSVLTIKDDYLSVIIDGNGNGWDFFVVGTAQEIELHIRSLLSKEEQDQIQFKHV